MPSHIYDRKGMFHEGEAANRKSVAAADAFAASGALEASGSAPFSDDAPPPNSVAAETFPVKAAGAATSRRGSNSASEEEVPSGCLL